MARLKIQRNRKPSKRPSTAIDDLSGIEGIGDSAPDGIVDAVIGTSDDSGDSDSGNGIGDSSGDGYTIPGDIDGTGTGGDSSPRKRGRPKGSGAGRSSKKTASDLDGILYHAHLVLASLSSIPEAELTEEQSQKLAAVSERLLSFYSDMEIPAKTAAWIQFGITAGGIYGPKYVAWSLRTKKEKRTGKSEPQKNNGPQISPISFPTGAAHA